MSGGGDIDMLSCANCGKGEENSNKLKKCSACLSVKYCSAACQKAHRPQHKKACKRRAAELHDTRSYLKIIHPEKSALSAFFPYLGKREQNCCKRVVVKSYVMVVFMQWQ